MSTLTKLERDVREASSHLTRAILLLDRNFLDHEVQKLLEAKKGLTALRENRRAKRERATAE